MIKKLLKDRSGFTLFEIIIVLMIASSIVIVVSNLSGNISLLNNLVSQQLQSKSDISQTLQIMTTEIRSASPSAGGAYPVESAATGSLIFYSDVNKDGLAERIRYFLASSSIYRGTTQPTGTPSTYPSSSEIATVIIDNVIIPSSTQLFSYYNSAYTGTQSAMTSTADVSQIRAIKISLYSDVQPKQSPGPQYFSAFSDIRNLRSN